jgi:hypothetical protein
MGASMSALSGATRETVLHILLEEVGQILFTKLKIHPPLQTAFFATVHDGARPLIIKIFNSIMRRDIGNKDHFLKMHLFVKLLIDNECFYNFY